MYHINHVDNFLQVVDLAGHKVNAIKKRAADTAIKPGSKYAGYFVGSCLDGILGDPTLAKQFRNIWETKRQLIDR